jgi:KEOPS complex subunit Cgi121
MDEIPIPTQTSSMGAGIQSGKQSGKIFDSVVQGDYEGNDDDLMRPGTCVIHQIRLNISDQDEFLNYIKEIEECNRVHIILFNADRMAGRAHVESALAHAFRAFKEGNAISKSVEMESLLYAAGSRQCQQGTVFGVHPGMNRLYLCICPGNKRVQEEFQQIGVYCDEEDWESLSEEKRALLMELFGITIEEIGVVGISRIEDLVLERVALLEVNR